MLTGQTDLELESDICYCNVLGCVSILESVLHVTCYLDFTIGTDPTRTKRTMSHTRPIIAFAVPRFLIDPCEHECQERKKKGKRSGVPAYHVRLDICTRQSSESLVILHEDKKCG